MTPDDLKWWLKLAPTLPWQFARTMPKYPHSYVVKDQAKFGLSTEEFDRAVLVIRQFGQPRRFLQHNRIYLVDEESDTQWWTMGDTLGGTTIINTSQASVTYGPQHLAPRTTPLDPRSNVPAAEYFDSLGPVWDEVREREPIRNDLVRRIVIRTFGGYAPSTLDVGAGTGRLLDLGITATAMCTVVDPSRGMLNELLRKHPKFKPDQVVPETAEVYLSDVESELPDFEMVTAIGGSAGYLSPDTIKTLWYLPSALLVLEFDLVPPPSNLAPDYWAAWEAACNLPDVKRYEHDGFQTVVLTRG